MDNRDGSSQVTQVAQVVRIIQCVIVSRLMKTPFCVLCINLYYMKLSAKRLVHVAPMSILLTLSQMVTTLTKVTYKSNLHRGGTTNLSNQ